MESCGLISAGSPEASDFLMECHFYIGAQRAIIFSALRTEFFSTTCVAAQLPAELCLNYNHHPAGGGTVGSSFAKALEIPQVKLCTKVTR